jgi:hypothetical protein
MRLLLVLLISVTTLAQAADRAVRHIVSPGYPRLARIAQLQGPISVDVWIAPDGKIVSAKASGAHQLLLRETEDNVRKWIFEPSAIHYRYILTGKQMYADPVPAVSFDLPNEVEIRSNPFEPQP